MDSDCIGFFYLVGILRPLACWRDAISFAGASVRSHGAPIGGSVQAYVFCGNTTYAPCRRGDRHLDEDEFRIQDDTGSIRVYIGWKNRVLIPLGERMTVRGFVDDDLDSYFRPEFYAFEKIREDGAVIKLNQE